MSASLELDVPSTAGASRSVVWAAPASSPAMCSRSIRLTTSRCVRPRDAAGPSAQPLLEVPQKLIDGLVGLGVLGHLAEELRGHRHDIGAGLQRLVDVHDVPDTAHDDLSPTARFLQRGVDLSDDRAGVVSDVPDPAPEE